MEKVKIKGMPFKFYKQIIKVGEKLNFEFINSQNEKRNISSIKGTKLISFFPAINTKICDEQTQWIIKNAPKSNIKFISISTDSIEKQKQWCAAHGFDNVQIISDAKLNDFGHKTGLLITKIKKLGRGFIVLNDENTIIDLFVNKEITEKPDFAIPSKYL